FQLGRLVKIDRVCADQRSPIIVDDEFVAGATDSEARTERETRPIRSCAHDMSAGQIFSERIMNAALFFSGVGGGAHVRHSTKMGIGGFYSGQRFLDHGLFGATDEKTNNCNN